MFFVLSIVFAAHPQPLPSLTIGHKTMSYLFFCLALVEGLSLAISHCFNTLHHRSQFNIRSAASKDLTSSCECGCGVKSR